MISGAAHRPTEVESAHIRQALDASQTAIDAISTIVSVSSWTLGIIAVFLGLVALWGYAAIRKAASDEAKRIANATLDTYIDGEEFRQLVKERIAKSVEEQWGKTVVLSRLQEEPPPPNDPQAFPPRNVHGEQQ